MSGLLQRESTRAQTRVHARKARAFAHARCRRAGSTKTAPRRSGVQLAIVERACYIPQSRNVVNRNVSLIIRLTPHYEMQRDPPRRRIAPPEAEFEITPADLPEVAVSEGTHLLSLAIGASVSLEDCAEAAVVFLRELSSRGFLVFRHVVEAHLSNILSRRRHIGNDSLVSLREGHRREITDEQ
jgi:hypothetical protein